MTTLEITAADQRHVTKPVAHERRTPAILCPTCREPVPLADGFGETGLKQFFCTQGHRFGQNWALDALHDIAAEPTTVES